MADVTLPQLGETVTEGTITQWFKQVGDAVAADEPLFEVSTDKVDTEVPSPVAGVLSEIRVAEGDTVDVGVVVAVVGDAAAAPALPQPSLPLPLPSPLQRPSPLPAPEPAPAPAPAPAPSPPRPPSLPQRPRLRLLRPPLRRRRRVTVGCCRRSCDGSSTSTPSIPTTSPARAPVGGSPVRTCWITSTPRLPSLPLRLPLQLPLPLPLPCSPAPAPAPLLRLLPPRRPCTRSCAGTGSRGTCAGTRSRRGARSRSCPAPAPLPVAGERDTSVRLSKIRQLTGDHMVMSKATSPHAFSVVEVDFANVDEARNRVKAEFKATEGFSLTYLPFITRAIVDGLHEFPHLNASVGDNELVVHHYIDLGIAVDLEYEGLLAPVIRNAETKRLRAIAHEISDLANRARTRKLSPDEISGGTFTISNNGSAGSVLTMPIINQPQVGIISTDAIVRKPVVVNAGGGAEAIAIHPVGNLAMAWDHRAFDGAYAAGFLKRVKQVLETRDWSAEL